MEEFNWTIPQLRDQRYEAVVHLVTAAIGAERFYTLENNKARMVRYRRPAVAFTPSTRLVTIRRGRGWFIFLF